MNKTKVKMSTPVYLGLSIFGIKKTEMYEFWYHYTKPKVLTQCKTMLYGYISYIETENIYIDISEDVRKDLTGQTMKLKGRYQ